MGGFGEGSSGAPRLSCAIRGCQRQPLPDRQLCGVHAEEIDAGNAVVWSGRDLIRDPATFDFRNSLLRGLLQ